MSIYCVGDIHGCDYYFQKLLDLIDFSPSRDTLYLLGDLVNRGPKSLKTLRRCAQADDAIKVILGNHDLHLLARYYGARKAGKRDTLDKILSAKDCFNLMHWLRMQPLVRMPLIAGYPLLIVHAGVLPQWTAQQTISLASEVENVLRGPDVEEFMHVMYGNEPNFWREAWQGNDRLRVIVNALTRLRYCNSQGEMDFSYSGHPKNAPSGILPWFEVPSRRSLETKIAFGHWSTLGLQNRNNILALDTGCVWGGELTALRFGENLEEMEWLQVPCASAQKPD